MKLAQRLQVYLLPPEPPRSDVADASTSPAVARNARASDAAFCAPAAGRGVGRQASGYALVQVPPSPPPSPAPSRPSSPSSLSSLSCLPSSASASRPSTPPLPAERSLLLAELQAEPRGPQRDALACAKVRQLEPRYDLTDLTQRTHDVATWLLQGHVGRTLRRLSHDGVDQRALLRGAVPFVALGLLGGPSCVDGRVPGATEHGGAVLWRLQNTAHAVAMRCGIATPAVRRMLKPVRHNACLLAREPAAEVLLLALRYAVEESCGLGAEENLARLQATPASVLRQSLYDALCHDCLLPMAQRAPGPCWA